MDLRPRRPWRRYVVLAVFGTALMSAGLALSVATTVALGPQGPSPAATTVGWGDTVVFTNNDGVAHGITSSKDELNVASIPAHGSFSVVMTGRNATYHYRQTVTKGRSLQGSVALSVVGSVSMKSSKAAVVYGKTLTLSGTASLHGTPVLVESREHGAPTWKTLKTLTSNPSSGAYSVSAKPAKGTKYRATIFLGQIKSALASVTVTPKLTIKSKTKKAQANHKVTITSTITPGSGASKITLLQCNASKGAWSRIANAKPNKKGVVTYHWKLPVGKNYFKTRVIDHNGASGYQRPTSGKITIQGLGTVHAAVPPRAKHVKAC